MESQELSLYLNIDAGAARIRVARPVPPSRTQRPDPEPREISRQRHSMTLRSQSHLIYSASSSSLSDSSLLTDVNATMAPERMAFASPTEDYPSQRQTYIQAHDDSPTDNMQGSFLSTPCTQGHSRYVWGLQSSDQDFVIWEDPMADNGGFPFVMTPRLYSETEEDKENTYATVSDYESPTDSEHPARVDWTRIQTASRDVFGLPRDPSFGPELADLSMTPARVGNSVPTVTETSIRPAIRVMERDEDDPEDWDDSLSTAQIRELQELSDIYHRGAESRRQHDRHFPMRDENVQGQANIFLEVRRVTQFQRHENRQSPFAMDEDD